MPHQLALKYLSWKTNMSSIKHFTHFSERAHTFCISKLNPSNLVTFPKIYVGTIWHWHHIRQGEATWLISDYSGSAFSIRDGNEFIVLSLSNKIDNPTSNYIWLLIILIILTNLLTVIEYYRVLSINRLGLRSSIYNVPIPGHFQWLLKWSIDFQGRRPCKIGLSYICKTRS